MKDRSIGLAVVAVVMLAAAAIYVLLNPLKWSDGDRPRETAAQEARPETKAEPASAPNTSTEAPEATKRAPRLGLFDVARIDPNGTSVFAGLAAPNETVNVLVDGAIIGTAKADANGEWVVVSDRKIASAEPKLSIAYGQQAPVPGRLASAERTDGKLRTALASPEGEPRTVRDVDARVLRRLGDLVAAARREEEARNASARAVASPAPLAAAPPAPTTGAAPMPSPSPAPADQRAVATTAAGGAPAGAPPQSTARAEIVPRPATANSQPAVEPAKTAVATAPAAPFKVASAEPAKPSGQGRSVASGETLPVPIRFVYREATFTEHGKAAAMLLLEYLRLKKVQSVTLTGHADERGSYDLNMELSSDRLKTVETFLRMGGYRGELKLQAKGKTEPYAEVDRSRFNREQLYELDRRVELKVYN